MQMQRSAWSGCSLLPKLSKNRADAGGGDGFADATAARSTPAGVRGDRRAAAWGVALVAVSVWEPAGLRVVEEPGNLVPIQ